MLSTLNVNRNGNNWLRDMVSLAILLGVFYALWIGSHPLFTPDEGRYSEVAREMVVTGDYITPRLNGVVFLDKPVLYYWLQASAIKLFGLKEWSLRLWPALLGVLGTLVLYGTGRLLFNRRTGVLAACILATSPLYYGGAHYANLDLEVATLTADALLCFIAAMRGGASSLVKNYLLLAAYVFAAAAALTKGLIGIVFPALIIGAWILILQRWDILGKMRLAFGLGLFVVLTLPWYVLVQKANPEFLHFFFYTQQISRFLTMQAFNSKAVGWFYVPVVLAGFFPWSVFLIQTLAQKLKLVWVNRQAYAVELYLLLWLVIIFVFFSIPRSKTVGYILPIFPVLALLTASYLNDLWEQPRAKGIFSAAALYLVLSVAVAGFLFVAPSWTVLNVPADYFVVLRALGLVMASAAFITFVFARKTSLLPLVSGMTVTAAVLLLMFISSVSLINQKSIKPIALELKSQLQANDEVVTFYKYYQDLPIYLERRVTIVADWHAPDIAYNDNWLREMWYGMVFQDTKKWLIEQDAFWQRWNSNKRVFVVTDTDNYKALQGHTKVYKIVESGDNVLLSNRASSTL